MMVTTKGEKKPSIGHLDSVPLRPEIVLPQSREKSATVADLGSFWDQLYEPDSDCRFPDLSTVPTDTLVEVVAALPNEPNCSEDAAVLYFQNRVDRRETSGGHQTGDVEVGNQAEAEHSVLL
jgi:hypothetical protein